MKEEVYHTNYYRFGYRVEKQLLLSLKSIFEKYTSNVKIRINVECNNNVTYKFESIDECFEYFNNFPYRIIKMEIEALFDERYNCNSVTIALIIPKKQA